MKSLKPFVLVIFFFSFFISCKKGEEDPALPSKTRKSRMAGDWHIKEGSVGLTENNADKKISFSRNLVITEGGSKIYETPTSQQLVIYTFIYDLSLKIEKDGTFSMEEQAGVHRLSASGTWNFTGKIGESKNKDGVLFIITNVATGATDYNVFNRGVTQFSFHLTKLSNEEIKLNFGNKTYIDSQGSYVQYSGHMTLIQ